jgi:hypothetical protein
MRQGSFTARNAKIPATVAAIPPHSIHMSGPNARRAFAIARCADGSESGEVGGTGFDHVSRGGVEPNGAALGLGGAATVTDGAPGADAATGWGPDGERPRPGGFAGGVASRSISPSRRFRRQCVHRTTESRISPPQCGQVFTC